jgi:hypothetical protein
MLAANSDLLDQIENADIFVASHHGRENGCCDLLYDYNNWKPDLTIISDSGIEHATQETVNWYHARTNGIAFRDGNIRRVLTTRSDGAVRITPRFDGTFHVRTQA